MSDVVLKIDADVAQYISKMARAGQSTKKVAKDAASIGDGFTSSLVKLAVLQRAITAAGTAVTSILDKSKSASMSAGERAVGLTTSLGSLGVKNAGVAADRYAAAQGSATLEQRASFASALASANASRRTPFSQEQIAEGLGAYRRFGDTTFAAGGSELIKGMERGLSVSEITAAAVRKRGGLLDPTSTAGKEIGMRRAEDISQQQEERLLGDAGLNERERALAYRNLANSSGLGGQILNAIVPDVVKEAVARSAESIGVNTVTKQSEGTALKQSAELNRLMRMNLTQPQLRATLGD